MQTTIDEYIKNTLFQNFYLFKHYPNYVFNFEGGVKYGWMKEYYPSEYELVKKYIKEGRWHVSGSSWDANDPNMPSPESFFRNILLGQQFYKKEFGVTSTDIFLPDCFGFSYTLPTVAAHCGLIGFSTQKLQWRHRDMHGKSKMPFNIGLWQGVDGSRIMAALNGKNYVHEWNGDDISTDTDLRNTAQDGVNHTTYRYYGAGDRGGSANINSAVSIEKGVKGQGEVEIISATSDQLYKDYLPFDKKGNSFAAELIGEEVISDNIPFRIVNHEKKNVIKCKGDTIRLPKETAGKKLYILATSTDKDRKATFLIDGKPHEFNVPYYSGFYGQWGHTGVSDGFIRDASLAYVGSHRHTAKGNEAYIFTYMYKFGIELSKEVHTLVLPQDDNIAVSANGS